MPGDFNAEFKEKKLSTSEAKSGLIAALENMVESLKGNHYDLMLINVKLMLAWVEKWYAAIMESDIIHEPKEPTLLGAWRVATPETRPAFVRTLGIPPGIITPIEKCVDPACCPPLHVGQDSQIKAKRYCCNCAEEFDCADPYEIYCTNADCRPHSSMRPEQREPGA